MTSQTPRALTPARIVALALVAIAVLGLGQLRVASGNGAMAVPEGARAGDLTLEPCAYETDDGAFDADCGTLVVPENRGNPKSRLIALPVKRIRATSGEPARPILRLEGGPGKTNMKFPMAGRFADHRDVVLVGYRGVDGSVRLDCPEVESALKHSTELLDDSSLRAYAGAFRACADRLTDEGVDLAGYTLAERVDDLEAARIALGYHRVDLVSESAGTRYALVYAWRHPKSIGRSVMIGANPPGGFLWDGATTDEQLRRYASLCERDADCASRTDGLAADIRRVVADLPDRWLFLPIREGNVRVATFYGLVESGRAAAPISAPMTIDALLSASSGDPSGLWLQSLLADLVFPESFVWGELAAMGMADAEAATRYYGSTRHGSGEIIGNPGTDFIWAKGRLGDAWPAASEGENYSRLRTSRTETLLVNGALDVATPPQAARKLLAYLPNGRRVVLPGLGHTTSFWAEQPDASTRLIETFLATGRVDDSLYEPIEVDLSPGLTQTVLAKGIAGTMAGLALLSALSLLWMARRVHWQGRLGWKTAAFLRSAYTIVLGLGGWFLAVLVVSSTMPTVPLDDELLATLSVGIPIGIGVYLSWVHRDWVTDTRATGFAAAAGGALVGAWLGFGAAEDLAALLTTVAGATVGANLAVLVLDIVWDRRAHDRFAIPDAVDPTDRRLSTGQS